MNRQERRKKTHSKWISRLKKFWESNTFFSRVREVKKNINYKDCPTAESYDDFKHDNWGVKIKNTPNTHSHKELDDKEKRKENLNNRKLTEEEIIEAETYIDSMNNIYSFEKYCGSCDNFITDNCPFKLKACEDSEWRLFGCDSYIN